MQVFDEKLVAANTKSSLKLLSADSQAGQQQLYFFSPSNVAIALAISAVITQQEQFRMIIDRSLLCAIRDNQTGTVLFMSAIVEP